MAVFFSVDQTNIPEYVSFFDIETFPSSVFLFNCEQMRIDFGCTPDTTKFVGSFQLKQDLIDLIEVIYRGAMKGKHIVESPIPHSRIPKYDLLYKGV